MRPGPRRTAILAASLLAILGITGPAAGDRLDLPDGSTLHYGTIPIDRVSMEYLLMWNPTSQDYDIYDHGSAGVTAVDDPNTPEDDRSVSHGGTQWDDSLYEYPPATTYLQYDNPSAVGGFDDVKVRYPRLDPLDAGAAEAYAAKVAAAVRSLNTAGIIHVDGLSTCGPAEHGLPIGAEPKGSDVWVFAGPEPVPLKMLPDRWRGVGCFLP